MYWYLFAVSTTMRYDISEMHMAWHRN